jgi:two-component system response regulator DctR
MVHADTPSSTPASASSSAATATRGEVEGGPARDLLVSVVDDDPAIAELIRRLCTGRGLNVATYLTANEFLAAFDAERPGCMVLDLHLPDLSGLELLERLAARNATQPIVFISGYAEVEHAVKAMKMGVLDFLEKPFRNQELIESILSALARDADIRHRRREQSDIAKRMSRLTRREGQVLDMVVQGMPNKNIAATLSLSPKTVEVYRANVMAKMEASSLAELVRMVLKQG